MNETQPSRSQQQVVRCPDPMCGAYHGHSPTCSIAPVEYKAEEMARYYKAWLDESKRHERTRQRLSEMVTLWQGKHALLRHENNKLRRKLRKTPKRKVSDEPS